MGQLERDHRGDDQAQATSTGAHVERREGTRDDGAVLRGDERSELRERWDALQGRFVDDPGEATRLADELVRDTRDRVTRRLEERHEDLTHRWKGREESTTDDLRSALRSYRDLFERLLAS